MGEDLYPYFKQLRNWTKYGPMVPKTLDRRQIKTVIFESQETKEVSPMTTLAYCLEKEFRS